MNKRLLLGMVFLTGLSACSHKPTKLALYPETPVINQKAYADLQIGFEDTRYQQHLIQVHRSNSAPQLIEANVAPVEVIRSLISRSLKAKGISFSPTSKARAKVEISNWRTKVEQGTVDYQANTIIELKITVRKENKTLTKIFKGDAKKRGPFSMSVANMELEQSQLLNKIANDIVNDQQLMQFIGAK
ncbi:YajG family lipoprotein [Paraferrimonas sp. SM1919]|uniref:YajG family lipoprotein n=1 Tax=Paraferrimonas sp. SM1919 TaxID=2662263 RepID=UPI0013D2A301|nr:YajG family lipoprotein [Paraferrimonas sp. SM1919]